jgi:uncharacterized membrane protein YhfC
MMLYFLYPLEGFLIILLALGLGLFLHHRLGMAWRLYVVGVLTFIASQVVHIPLLIGLTAAFSQHLLPAPPAEWQLPFNAVVLGLLAGLCEELARWAAYRFVIRKARTWQAALMFGAGHGGIEALIVGLGVIGAFIAFNAMSPAQVDALPAAAQAQAQALRSPADLTALIGLVERAFALCIHLGLAVLVLQTFTRGSPLYLVAAIAWHALVDGVSVYAAPTWGIGVTESIVGVMALLSLGIVYAFRPGNALKSEPEKSHEAS